MKERWSWSIGLAGAPATKQHTAASVFLKNIKVRINFLCNVDWISLPGIELLKSCWFDWVSGRRGSSPDTATVKLMNFVSTYQHYILVWVHDCPHDLSIVLSLGRWGQRRFSVSTSLSLFYGIARPARRSGNKEQRISWIPPWTTSCRLMTTCVPTIARIVPFIHWIMAIFLPLAFLFAQVDNRQVRDSMFGFARTF